MSLNNGVFARDAQGSMSTNFDDVLYSPEMDAMLDDRLEQARQNRTNYYRKMLASRSRPLDDYTVTKKVSYRSKGSPVKEPSISDTVPGPLPKIPEPHSSWRFYTSYDNGEWKRHAVPVHKEEEEILREPKKSLRRERDTELSTQSAPVESSLRKMRQTGGSLVACLQPRPKKTSDTQKITTVHMVNGQPSVGGATEFGGQFGLPDWANVYGNGDLVRRYSDGGTEYILLDGEPSQGSMKQECSSKYTSTVTVTQPNVSHLKPGVPGAQAKGVVGGEAVGQGETGESGVRKSRRPRIYGFQEKIIIPTKYKNMETKENGGEKANEEITAAGQSASKTADTRGETTLKKVSIVQDGMKVKEGGVGVGGVGWGGEVGARVQARETIQSVPASSHLKAGSGTQGRTLQGQTVKVVVVNSGSHADSEKKPDEPSSSENVTEVRDNALALKLDTGMPESLIQIPILFQDGKFPMEEIKAFHESFHANLLPAVSPAKDRDDRVLTIEDKTSLEPNQRVFSKEEEAFSEVGPDGTKCDGKVSRTYAVYTTTNEENPDIQNKQLSPKEVTVVPIQEAERSPLKTRSISSTREDKTTSDHLENSGSHFSQQKTRSSLQTTPVVSPRTDDKKATDIFEQTGSLFKTITPRPRSAREQDSVFTSREGHLRKASDDGAPQRFGGVTSKTSRVLPIEDDGFKRESGAADKASTKVGAGETVRMKVEHVSTENRSSRQPPSTGPAAGKALERDSLGAFATAENIGFSKPDTNSRVRSQGWSNKTQNSSLRTTENLNEKDWEIQVAVKD